MLQLAGKPVYTPERLMHLLERCQQQVPSLSSLDLQYAYFIQSEHLSEEALLSLSQLLDAQAHEPSSRNSMVIMPNLDLEVDMWSFQVTRLVSDCGIRGIKRIIQVRLLTAQADQLDLLDTKKLAHILFDPATEIVVPDMTFACQLFSEKVCATEAFQIAKPVQNSPSLWSVRWTINGEIAPRTLLNMVSRYNTKPHKQLLFCESNWAVIRGIASKFVQLDHATQTYQLSDMISYVSCHVRQLTINDNPTPFDALSFGQGHRLKSLMSGYCSPDLFIPQHVQAWEQATSIHSRVAVYEHLVRTVLRRGQFWHRLGVPLMGGFLRTAMHAIPYATSVYFGGMHEHHIYPHYQGDIYVLERGLQTAITHLIGHCSSLVDDNPINATRVVNGYLWCYINPKHKQLFEYLAKREGCRFCVISQEQADTILQQPQLSPEAHDLRVAEWQPVNAPGKLALSLNLQECIERVLKAPAVAAKSFILNHADHSVGGRVVRDPMVGPWQLPVADVAVRTMGYRGARGFATAYGEKQPLMALNPLAGMRMAIGEAITNLCAADITSMRKITLAPTWYISYPPQDCALYRMLESLLTDLSSELGFEVATDDIESHPLEDPEDPLFLNVTIAASSATRHIRSTLLPRCKRHSGETYLMLIDLAAGKQRLGGSILSQVMQLAPMACPDANTKILARFIPLIKELRERKILLAYHDRSDGGLLVTLLEMAFTNRVGLDLYLDTLGDSLLSALFNEELGVVIQIPLDRVDEAADIIDSYGIDSYVVGQITKKPDVVISYDDIEVFHSDIYSLCEQWLSTSRAIEHTFNHPDLVEQEYQTLLDPDFMGLYSRVPYDFDRCHEHDEARVNWRIAILRHPDSTGEGELASAFQMVGFEAVDLTMDDLRSQRYCLADFHGLAICGGSTYQDHLGAGKGWAQTILQHRAMREQFASFFAHTQRFVLGVGNGAQLLTHLRDIIPGSALWPDFQENSSGLLESRLVMVGCSENKSVLFNNMAGSALPIIVSCTQGRCCYAYDNGVAQLSSQQELILSYIDSQGESTQCYPQNPCGSEGAIAGFCNEDGRISALMCHPERLFMSVQFSYFPNEWDEFSPWIKLFRNAYDWLSEVNGVEI
jgi:phosphoribosylformylglycinamidine (FGAM) synthase-like amidotransferase family enzyme